MIEVGVTYVHQNKSFPIFRCVDDINDGKVYYRRIKPSRKMEKNLLGRCGLKSFENWQQGIVPPGADLDEYFGHKKYPYHIILNTQGLPLVNASQPTIDRYLRKGYVKVNDDGTYQFINDTAEVRLKEIHGELNESFLEIKNHHCYVCGKTTHLTKHHVVPVRHHADIKHISKQAKKLAGGSWTVCVCMYCHYKADKAIEGFYPISDPITEPKKWLLEWEMKFRETMNPQHLIDGWTLVYEKTTMIEQPELVEEYISLSHHYDANICSSTPVEEFRRMNNRLDEIWESLSLNDKKYIHLNLKSRLYPSGFSDIP